MHHVVRTIKGANDAAYKCVFQEEDADGIVGVKLSRDLMSIAGLALKTNITTLGPLVLPWSEQLLFVLNLFARKVLRQNVKPYIPDFKLAFEHFCIHTGAGWGTIATKWVGRLVGYCRPVVGYHSDCLILSFALN